MSKRNFGLISSSDSDSEEEMPALVRIKPPLIINIEDDEPVDIEWLDDEGEQNLATVIRIVDVSCYISLCQSNSSIHDEEHGLNREFLGLLKNLLNNAPKIIFQHFCNIMRSIEASRPDIAEWMDSNIFDLNNILNSSIVEIAVVGEDGAE